MRLQLGFVPLCDAAPLIAAHELGFARAEGLDLDLTPEPSWATLRDRLALGHLDGAHMLAPLALASALALSGPPAEIVVPLVLSLNGNAITLSRPLWEAMAPDGDGLPAVAAAFARVAGQRRAAGKPLTLGTVHPFSCHTYQLRLFAEAAGLEPGAFRTVVVPPQHSVEALARGIVDGYCAGAPWNDVAVAANLGRIAALGCELSQSIVPRSGPRFAGKTDASSRDSERAFVGEAANARSDAPEKVLAVSARLGEATLPLVRAVARAGRWCAEPGNRTELAHRLARRGYLDLDAAFVARAFGDTVILDAAGAARPNPGPLRLGEAVEVPEPGHALWVVGQMQAAGQVPPDCDAEGAAAALYRPDMFSRAMAAEARLGAR